MRVVVREDCPPGMTMGVLFGCFARTKLMAIPGFFGVSSSTGETHLFPLNGHLCACKSVA